MAFLSAHRYYQGMIVLLLGLLAGCRSERVAFQVGAAPVIYAAETHNCTSGKLLPVTALPGRCSVVPLPAAPQSVHALHRNVTRTGLPVSGIRSTLRNHKPLPLCHHTAHKLPVTSSHSPIEYRYPPDFLAVPIATTGASIALLALYLTLGSSAFFTLSVVLGILSVLLLAVVIVMYAIGGSGHKLGG